MYIFHFFSGIHADFEDDWICTSYKVRIIFSVLDLFFLFWLPLVRSEFLSSLRCEIIYIYNYYKSSPLCLNSRIRDVCSTNLRVWSILDGSDPKKSKNKMAIFILFKNVTTFYTNIFWYVQPLRSFFLQKDRQTETQTALLK